eukprot:TRINITY_DN13582_c0_g1_i1.p1 TRINITY_DN13582_c0_g1~~TRINITY_DN13582_c0_g1_i1.p1  ORF type:complete len:619 (+),score=37.37 TRINITY_DN13582_c0_g1_i1:214-2070(+)
MPEVTFAIDLEEDVRDEQKAGDEFIRKNTTAFSSTRTSNATRTTYASNRSMQTIGSISGHSTLAKEKTRYQVSVLPMEIPDSLMRAVPLTRALSNFGQYWKSIDAKASDYDISENVVRLDDFISHDWTTPRFLKVIALCFYYNAEAAAVASLVIGALTCWIQSGWSFDFPPEAFSTYETQEYVAISNEPIEVRIGWLAYMCCPIVYLLVLCFGQRFRGRFISERLVFLDKLCIHQTDDKLKSAGILGLAGFLQRSDRLLVLWTPRYFTRLWCAYEIAVWSRLGKSFEDSVCILPVQLPLALLFFKMSAHTFFLSFRAVYLAGGFSTLLTLAIFSTFVSLSILCLWSVLWEIQSVPAFVEKFSIQLADCYCCTHRHRHPVSCEPIPCDRRLIYKSIDKWLSTDAADAEEAAASFSNRMCELNSSRNPLDAVNAHLKKELDKCVKCHGFTSNVLRYRDCICSCSLPFMWAMFDCPQVPANMRLYIAVWTSWSYLILMPTVIGLLPAWIRIIARVVGTYLPSRLSFIASIAALTLVTISVSAGSLVVLTILLNEQLYGILCLWCLVSTGVTIYLFFRWPAWLSKLWNEELPPAKQEDHSDQPDNPHDDDEVDTETVSMASI